MTDVNHVKVSGGSDSRQGKIAAIGLLGPGVKRDGSTHWGFGNVSKNKDPDTSLSTRLPATNDPITPTHARQTPQQHTPRNKRAAASSIDPDISPKKIKMEKSPDRLSTDRRRSSCQSSRFNKPPANLRSSYFPPRSESKLEVIELSSGDDEAPIRVEPVVRMRVNTFRPSDRASGFSRPAHGKYKPAPMDAEPMIQQSHFDTTDAKPVIQQSHFDTTDAKPIVQQRRFDTTPAKAQGPFVLEDESSEDEATTTATAFMAPTAQTSFAAKLVVAKPTLPEDVRAAQRKESERLRLEALRKKSDPSAANGHKDIPTSNAAPRSGSTMFPVTMFGSNKLDPPKRPLIKALQRMPSTLQTGYRQRPLTPQGQRPGVMTNKANNIPASTGTNVIDSKPPADDSRGQSHGTRTDLATNQAKSPKLPDTEVPFVQEQDGRSPLDMRASQPVDLARKIEHDNEKTLSELNAMRTQSSVKAARAAKLEGLRAAKRDQLNRAAEQADLEAKQRTEETSRRLIENRLEREAKEEQERVERHAIAQRLAKSSKASLQVVNKERAQQEKERRAQKSTENEAMLELKRAKTDRAQKLKERNARNAQADMDAEAKKDAEVSDTDRLVLDNAPEPIPTDSQLEPAQPTKAGPFSLNSAAGKSAMEHRANQHAPSAYVPLTAKLANHARQTQPGAVIANPHRPGQHQGRAAETNKSIASQIKAIGSITAPDGRLYLWREIGDQTWSQTIGFWKEVTGMAKGEDSLRKRFRALKVLVEHTEADIGLMEQLAVGDKEAEMRINRLAQDTCAVLTVAEERPTVRLAVRKDSSVTIAPQIVLPTFPQLPSAAQDSLTSASAVPRPTTGGKQLTAEFLASMAQNMVEAIEEANKADAESELESDMEAQDYCYRTYRIIRREFTLDDANKGYEADDMPWLDCCDALESVEEANSAAEKYLRFNRLPSFGHPDEEHREVREIGLARTLADDDHAAEVNNEDDEHDGTDDGAEGVDPPATDRSSHPSWHAPVTGDEKYFCLYRGSNEVQVRVIPQLRQAWAKKRPKSKKGWLSRTCWRVKQRVCSDALFGDAVAQDIEEAAYTDLSVANAAAVQYFVEKTAKPSNTNLHLFCAEKQTMLQNLLRELDLGDVFKGQAQVGEDLVEVWVAESKLVGPRN
ncbi:hypothetical protein TI39_contig4130g00007 [Zymoseptoria brevis]|uniref:Uncharacterized protein n=1 Tax=Zymoseptoria brevis TaxID=1047168 RepID=A0A0F4GG34_9PEZI|nr:hypothetical protein TI39_contig4130g00007 [Zymoseptoria brevis]